MSPTITDANSSFAPIDHSDGLAVLEQRGSVA